MRDSGSSGHSDRHPTDGQLLDGALIELKDVVKTYEVGLTSLTVLNHVDLVVRAGEFVSILGPSGSGKSTLLNMVAGIDKPTSGQVVVAGESIHTLDEDRLARWRGRYVGVVFQFFQLLPTLTILENVILPMDFCGVYHQREREQKAADLLEQVGLGYQAHKLPSTLSGGEQQRVAIARALANDPPLIVADEPTGNLDTGTSSAMFALFERLVKQGKTLFVVTHDLDLSARTQRVIRLVDGSIRQDEAVRQQLAKHDGSPEQGHDARGHA
jgi:putative ABC transport system ATP-binding protein